MDDVAWLVCDDADENFAVAYAPSVEDARADYESENDYEPEADGEEPRRVERAEDLDGYAPRPTGAQLFEAGYPVACCECREEIGEHVKGDDVICGGCAS